MSHLPPKWPIRFLRWFCNPDFLEEIEGDLFEIFDEKVINKDPRYARRTFLLDVLKFFRWSNFKNLKKMPTSITPGLWKHNLNITFRVFRRNKLSTSIHISGLVLGIAAFFVLLAYYLQETSFDKFFPDHENIYRVAINSISDGNYTESAQGPIPLIEILDQKLSQSILFGRMMPWSGYLKYDESEKFKETQFVFADEEILSIFPLNVREGSLKDVFNAPFQLVITERKARQYFGDTSPIGKLLKYEDEYNAYEFKVIAVIDDLPANSHLNIDFLASFSSLKQIMPHHEKSWFYPSTFLYTKLYNAANVEETNRIAQNILMKNGHQNYLQENPELVFQSLTDIHLGSNRQGEWKANNTQINIKFFLGLGIFILMIAVINYINLVTASGMQRSKEIGIKKAIGSHRMQLIRQFYLESFIIIVFSTLLAIALLSVLWLPLIRHLLNDVIILPFLLNYMSLIWLLTGIIILTILAGTYPALTIVRFHPIDVIKNNLSKYSGKGRQRKVLVTLQFAIALCQILFTMLLIKQYYYLQNKNIGFQKDYRITLRMIDEFDKQNYEILKTSLMNLPFVESAAVSNTVIGVEDGFYGFPVEIPDRPDLSNLEWNTLGVDEDYLTTFDIKLIDGRDFNKAIKSDESSAFIINQSAAKMLGFEDQTVGKDLNLTIYAGRANIRKGKIIGVTEDFNYRSLYESVKPLIVYINKHPYYTDFLNVKLNSKSSLVEEIESLKSTYAAFNPDKPAELIFLKDEIQNTYQRELMSSKLMTFFTFLCVFITALGVFGLATFNLTRRAKEIGIRKVMGANSRQITLILTKEYIYLIFIAALISWPIVYIFASSWLKNFAYSTEFNFYFYLLGLILIMLITVISSLYQILKSINMNSVELLKNE